MAPRRTHKKSRNGCDTCRVRHVKCDECGPPCTRCATRGLDCTFTKRLTSRQSSTHPSVPTPSPEQPLSSVGGSASVPSTRLLELELLHFYSTKTYQGFPPLSPDQNLWQVFAVEEALKFDFLMKEIFALAALHKATEKPELALEYVSHALEWQNQALALSRSALQNVTQENSGAVFIFSIMTMIFAIVPSDSVPGVSLKNPLESILLLFEFQKGTASVADLCRKWLESGPFRWIFESKSPKNIISVDEDYNTALIRLKELNNEYVTTNTTSPAIFAHAISSLSFCSDGSKGRILAWLAMAGQDFMTHLKEKEPMALLILLHWAVLMKNLNDLWWARNAGRRLVEDVAVALENVAFESGPNYSSKWVETVEWARLLP
ncbi:related to regulatory protein involved in control of sterol uptake [Phialocephala subalpina]|uniref:Related to regulatory protein involved in control of sterol uptake n=1 Tax=Phialocephala subalpina TaxID=576137 RepID=A0A1L7XKY7_9HELO|nr:related to regulatory protein involved in control of sterol uptake [Phialocephala subalpina]